MLNGSSAKIIFDIHSMTTAIEQMIDIVMRLICSDKRESCRTRRAKYTQTPISTTVWGTE